MLVDDEALVIGSSNFNMLSHRIQQELMAIVRDRQLIAAFRMDVLEPDLAQSVAPTRKLVPQREWLKLRAYLFGAWLTVRLSRLGQARPSDLRAGPAPHPAAEPFETAKPS
jgi:phosphatidylserine/phosphatidylglycerophosphate/cardiolipin synthase-like enzyme